MTTDPPPTAERSRLMGRVRSKDTKPEIAVRQRAHFLGYRFRLHRRDLPGTPDLAFPKHKMALFVHGCFWHRHEGCRRCTTPRTRAEFWRQKFEANVERDKKTIEKLKERGWRVGIIWECETLRSDLLDQRLTALLSPDAV